MQFQASPPPQGWARYLAKHMANNCHVDNLGSSGKSTTTFRSAGNWTEALTRQGDVYLVQFGYNDSHEGEPEYAAPDTTYRDTLALYVAEAEAQGAEVIIATPTMRNTWSGGDLVRELQDWVDAAIAEAAEQGVMCIDVNAAMDTAMMALGEAGVADYYNDLSHFTAAGAKWVASIVSSLLPGTSLGAWLA